MAFPHLKCLTLLNLPNLIAFCKASVQVELSKLEYLNLHLLTKLTSLYPGRETLASKHHQHCLFKQKVTLDNVATVAEIQPAQVPDDSISLLRSMRVDSCKRLLNVFPSNMIQQLQNLQYLRVSECSSVEVVFNLQLPNAEEGREVGVLPQLKVVYLTRLRELKHIWKEGLHVTRGFQNLTFLSVEACDSLETIFSASSAKGLVMLRCLYITNCQTLEAIFWNGGGEVLKIELPNLQSLHLVDLPNLIGFCDSVDEVKLPQLEYLKLQGVPKFAGVYPETESSDHHLASLEQPSFKPTDILTNVIKGLQNLQELEAVESDSIEVVFNLQEPYVNGGSEVVALNQLTNVVLSKLPKLKHVWEDGPHITKVFQNLRRIHVRHCDSLRQLFTTSMAKILVELEDIEIADCKLLEAIVAKEEGVEEEEECTMEEGILFPQLARLYLDELPNLLTLAPKAYRVDWSDVGYLYVNRCGEVAESLNAIILNRKKVALATEFCS